VTHLLTASRLGIGRACPGFASLPHDNVSQPGQADGIEKHADQDAAIKSGKVPSLYTERWPGMTWRSEVRFAINPTTGIGRELGEGGGRDYSTATADEVPGTADVVGLRPGLVVIVDKKQFDPGVPQAALNAQLHIAALAFCRAHGIDDAEVAIDHEARAFDVAALDPFDLESFRVELAEIQGAVALSIAIVRDGGEPILNEGTHCRWCPAFLAGCPLKQELRVQAERRLALIDDGRSPVPFLEDDNDAARAYEFSQRLSVLKKRIDAAVYARAKDKPFLVRPGVMLGETITKGKKKLDADKLYEIVKAEYGQGIADAAVIRSATQKRLEEALEFTGVASKAAAKKEMLRRLEETGGIAQDDKLEIDEYPVEMPMLKAVP
jgi:hypothetical protein